MFAAILLCGLTIASCTKDPVPTPEPEPDPEPQPVTVTRLARETRKVNNGMMELATSSNYTWDNGILTCVYDTISMGVINQTYKHNLIYENGLLVKVDEENGKWNYSFTYEDGLMKTFLNLRQGDTTAWGDITSYTADGLMETCISYNVASQVTKKTRWTLTWENGDAIKAVEEILEPEELVETHTYTYTYDDKPNARTGYPLGYALFDGNGASVAYRLSKHNQIEEGYTYDYNENGYLTSVVKENDSTFYNYIEQTLR